MKQSIQSGKAGTVSSRGLHSTAMGDGSGRPCIIIKDDRVMRYVGIGWIDERAAVQADAEAYPVVVYPENPVAHRAILG